jgi:hypothetical protein
MKNGVLFFLLFSSIVAFSQAKLEIKDSKKNFGFVKQGELVELIYEIENTGTQPLLFTEYKVACECTKVILPQKPLLPQEKGKITVHFDTKTVYDRQDRTVDLISNSSEGITKIRFKGVVLKPK